MSDPRAYEVVGGRSTSSDENTASTSVVRGRRCVAWLSKVTRENRAPGYASMMCSTSARTPSRRGDDSPQSSAVMLVVLSTTISTSRSVTTAFADPDGMPGRSASSPHATTRPIRIPHATRSPDSARTSDQTTKTTAASAIGTSSQSGRTGRNVMRGSSRR